jgi:hypothetical protein
MSAVAIADARTVVPELHLAEAHGLSVAEMHAKEMSRWMLWFGVPVLVMAGFMGATFVTGQLWGIGGVLAALIADICILIWLCMSSDTNGEGLTVTAAAH